MATLPARPSMDHLRRQARDLLRAARSGDAAAIGRIGAFSPDLTLAAAQLAIAREYGFASWPRLNAEVTARTADLARQAEAFCQASVRDGSGRAARMLAASPELADYSLTTAVILGDAARARAALQRDPSLARQTDPTWGWTALHAAAASGWHRWDPARAGGLLEVARLHLDAGADANDRVGGPDSGGWTPLRCAVAGAANPAMARLLLDHGAEVGDHELYLAGFAGGDQECLRLLIGHADVAGLAQDALAAPVSLNDAEGVRLLLEAGADPGRYADDTAPPTPAAYAAVRAGCSADLVALLLAHGADPDAPGSDGRSPIVLATDSGRTDLADLLRRHGATDDTTDADRFLAACLHADRAEATRLREAAAGLTAAQRADALVEGAEAGNAAAVGLMLDLGFAADARGGQYDHTALHAAAYSGSAEVVGLLLNRGADREAHDGNWDSTPLDWACVGSGERPDSNPGPDWVATVQTLLQAGASVAGITLSPDDPKPPSADVARLLREHGVGGADQGQ